MFLNGFVKLLLQCIMFVQKENQNNFYFGYNSGFDCYNYINNGTSSNYLWKQRYF
jgi:hypothetical protein